MNTLNVGDRIRILTPRMGQWFRIESLSESFVGIESGPLTRRLVEKGIANSTIQHASNAGAKVYDDLDEAKVAMGAGEVVVRLAPLARWIVVAKEQFDDSGPGCGWELEASGCGWELEASGCNDCGRPVVWDEVASDYRHIEPGVACFLIPASTPSSEFLARAAQALFDMGFGRLVMRESAS